MQRVLDQILEAEGGSTRYDGEPEVCDSSSNQRTQGV